MTGRKLALVVAIGAALAGLWLIQSLSGIRSPAAPAAVPSYIGHPEVGFREPSALAEHYRKHGAEFGDITEAEYLHRAQALRDRPAGGDVREALRRDGVLTRFDRRTGAFLAFDRDLTIRTFFRPNDGEAYFDRQLKRGASVP